MQNINSNSKSDMSRQHMIKKSQKGYVTSFLLKKAVGVFYSAFVGLEDTPGFYDIKLS